MKILHHLLFLAFFFYLSIPVASAQVCDSTAEVTIKVTIGTDLFPYEYSWDLIGLDSTVYGAAQMDATYKPDSVYFWELCLPIDTCAIFTIYDSFGDGMGENGFYAIAVNGLEVENAVLEGEIAKYSINCSAGVSCNQADVVGLGQYAAIIDNAWYEFTPENSGQYRIGTCNLASCDTKIWIFENCMVAHYEENNEGTIAFDDNYGNCGEQANLTTVLAKDVPVYIRIGDDHDDCGGDTIHWEIEFLGTISGCTDPNACNYNPLATEDDGSCLPLGDPNCPSAPDLIIREDILISSAFLDQIEVTDDCLIEEGCLKDYGLRDILRFTTRIENIGEADYYAGIPGVDDSQFTYNNCHNHWHYDGYAEYLLYDDGGQATPIGFKNGFCVIDLGCIGNTAKYNCGNMGISAGCYDVYSTGVDCQWIDVTDVPDGRYTFVTRVNWDNAPDALGRKETDSLNNWSQMCIRLDRSSGALQFIQEDDCPAYTDCNGVPFGDAQLDCTGVCAGTAVFGDLNTDGAQSLLDAEAYIDGLLLGNLPASTCNDLSGDGHISIYDAALMIDCSIYGDAYPSPGGGTENHCEFPHSLFNPNHSVGLTILDYDWANNYLDIGIKNTSTNVLGYQFFINGITITEVQNLADPTDYPTTPQYGADGMVVGVSRLDSSIIRASDWQPLLRIYYDGPINEEVCISESLEIVNEKKELTNTFLEHACIFISSQKEVEESLQVKVAPNPFDVATRLRFSNPEGAAYELRISDISGKVVQTIAGIRNEEVRIAAGTMARGLYLYQLIGEGGTATGKLLVE